MELPKINFDLEEAHRIYKQSPKVDKIIEAKGKKFVVEEIDIQQTIAYIQKYFYVTRGAHFLWDDEKFEYLTDETVRKTYFKRLPKDIAKWYFEDNLCTYKVINDVHKPRVSNEVGNRYINLCAGFKWKTKKPFLSFPSETQNKVKVLLAYMLEVLASSDDKVYQYLLKWYASICQGKKNDALLYYKGPEGIGKSSMSEFFIEFVLGRDICVRAPMSVLTTDNNALLCGKVFVSFLEMPTSSKGQWENISSRLKTMVTEKSLSFCNKYEKCYEAENINNYSIETNVEALKNSNGRRIFIDPISTKRKGDHEYFSKLKGLCYNDEVGEAFFNYLLEYETKDFNAQWHMPDTQAKLDAHVESLEVVYQFIKDEYILKSKPIQRCTIAELFAKYEAYCQEKDKKPLMKTKFNAKLKDVQINWKPSNNEKVYKMSLDELKVIAQKNKWIHYLDEVDEPIPVKLETPYLFADPLDYGVQKTEMAIQVPEDDLTMMLKKFLSEASTLHDIMKRTCAAFEAIKLDEAPIMLKREIANPNPAEIEHLKPIAIQRKPKKDIEKEVPSDEYALDATVEDLFNC